MIWLQLDWYLLMNSSLHTGKLEAVFHWAKLFTRSIIFFLFKTNQRRVGVRRQKKLLFHAENPPSWLPFTWRFLWVGSVQPAKLNGIIIITGVAGLLLRVKRRRCLWSSRTGRIGMSKIVEWEVAFRIIIYPFSKLYVRSPKNLKTYTFMLFSLFNCNDVNIIAMRRHWIRWFHFNLPLFICRNHSKKPEIWQIIFSCVLARVHFFSLLL